MYNYEDLLKMDKRTTKYKVALMRYKQDLETLRQKNDFLNSIYLLSKEDKKVIKNNAQNCYLTYLHNNAGKFVELKPVKEKLGMSWRQFNEFCLKLCLILDC